MIFLLQCWFSLSCQAPLRCCCKSSFFGFFYIELIGVVFSACKVRHCVFVYCNTTHSATSCPFFNMCWVRGWAMFNLLPARLVHLQQVFIASNFRKAVFTSAHCSFAMLPWATFARTCTSEPCVAGRQNPHHVLNPVSGDNKKDGITCCRAN